ncbi:MAG: glycosyltransferase family 25 protein [Pyrinomonadaceae bacterium]
MLSPSLKSFHDRIFVLTIPDELERQASIKRQLGAENFEFEFGLDGRAVSKDSFINDGIYDEAKAQLTDRHHRKLTLGNICCSLGHRQIYEKILDSNCKNALIFEDDAYALPASEEEISTALANIPYDADLVYWGWNGGRFRPRFGQMQQIIYHLRYWLGADNFNHTMIRNLYMRRCNEYFDKAAVNFLSHAYTVTRRAAEALLKWHTPVILSADIAMIHANLSGDIRSYVARKQLFGQRSIDASDEIESLTQE